MQNSRMPAYLLSKPRTSVAPSGDEGARSTRGNPQQAIQNQRTLQSRWPTSNQGEIENSRQKETYQCENEHNGQGRSEPMRKTVWVGERMENIEWCIAAGLVQAASNSEPWRSWSRTSNLPYRSDTWKRICKNDVCPIHQGFLRDIVTFITCTLKEVLISVVCGTQLLQLQGLASLTETNSAPNAKPDDTIDAGGNERITNHFANGTATRNTSHEQTHEG